MASISHDKKTGRRTIQFTAADGRRPSIRLGKVSKKQAETIRTKVEDLVSANFASQAPADETARWVAGLGGVLRRRLERVGLIRPREGQGCPTLGEWLQSYIEGRSDVKDTTSTVYGHTRRNLLAFFGETKRLDEITPGDADGFRVYLKTQEGLADNTVRRRIGIASQFLRAALRKKIIAENPFTGQSSTVRENPKRFHFVTRQEAQTVLDGCPDVRWRLVFALCRYAALRCPSEIVRLQWADINWDTGRFVVHASKTEHHDDAGIRTVPIFGELYSHLLDAFEQAEPGAVYCCPQYTNAGPMYRKTMLEIVKRAGLKPWPKLFQNCRSSRETELVAEYPIQTVCRWLGHGVQVAVRHYLQTSERDFEKAAQIPVQQTAAQTRTGLQEKSGAFAKANVCDSVRPGATPNDSRELDLVGVGGLEPNDVTHCETRPLQRGPNGGDANSGAVGVDSGNSAPDLADLIDVWDTLPGSIKTDITTAVAERLQAHGPAEATLETSQDRLSALEPTQQPSVAERPQK